MTVRSAADVHEAIQHVRWIHTHRELLRGEGTLKPSCALRECVPESGGARLLRGIPIYHRAFAQAVHGMFDSMWEQRNKGVRPSEHMMLRKQAML